MLTTSSPLSILQAGNRILRIGTIISGVGLCLLLLIVTSVQPARADERDGDSVDAPGSIRGTVTDSAGAPLQGIEIGLCSNPYYCDPVQRAVTGADGTYQVNLLSAGLYRVQFRDPDGVYVTTYYQDAYQVMDATEIPVAGNRVTGIDATMGQGGRITGTVTATTGLVLYGFTVYAYAADGDPSIEPPLSVYYGSPNEPYTLSGLATGAYHICADAYVDELGGYLFECYEDVVTGVAAATEVMVATGQTTPNINFVLGASAQYAGLAGTVTAPDGTPLPNISVDIFRHDLFNEPPPPGGYVPTAFSTVTDAQGRYAASALISGTYSIQFTDYVSNTYMSQFWGGAETIETADTITVRAGERRSDIDMALAVGGRIVGFVAIVRNLPPLNGSVDLYHWNAMYDFWEILRTAPINPQTGIYNIGGLRSGDYLIGAYGDADPFYSFQPFFKFYEDALYMDDASPVSVTAGETTSGIDIVLTDTLFDGAISGVVTAEGAPQEGIRVDLYSAYYSPPSLVYTYTNAAGAYSLGGLSGGEYYVGFSDPSGTYASVYHNGRGIVTPGEGIALDEAQTVADVDADLVLAGSISGSVHHQNGNSLAGVVLEIYLYNDVYGYWEYIPQPSPTTTAADGTYTIRGLLPGTYHVCMYDPNYAWPPQCFGGFYPDTASDVEVSTGATTANIDLIVTPTALDETPEPAAPELETRLFLPLSAR